MSYNDDFTVLTSERFAEIAQEYKKELNALKVNSLAANDKPQFDSACVYTANLNKILSDLTPYNKCNKKFCELTDMMHDAGKYLAEFYLGEFNQPFVCEASPINRHYKTTAEKFTGNLAELTKVLCRIKLADPKKQQIFANILDKYIDILAFV